MTTKYFRKKYEINTDSAACWADQGIVYIDNGTVPAGIYSFKKSKSKKVPVPIFIKEYKNRVELTKQVLKDLENNL